MIVDTEAVDKKKLELAMASINKEYGAGSIMRIGNANTEPWPSISTGALTLDIALGIGGLPYKRIIEIYGPESSGKSSVALSVVAEAQAKGQECLYVDTESALDPIYMKALGVDLDKLLLCQPDYGEQALDIVEKVVRTGEVQVVVVDSVAGLLPKAELEGTAEDNHMGLLPRMMSKNLRKMPTLVRDNGVCLIFINQIREKIGVMFGNPETQPGGRALKFSSSVRLEVQRKADIKNKDGELEGIKVRAKIVKNKMGPPFKIAEYDILYGKGIDKTGCWFDMAHMLGIFEGKNWIKYKDEPFAQGRANCIARLNDESELFEEIKQKVRETLEK